MIATKKDPIARREKKRDVPVKILGRGELTKKFTVHAHKFSGSARSAIEGAGGTCVVEE